METIITLYKYDPRMCACHEEAVFIRYNPAQHTAPLDDTLAGQIKRAWRTWRDQ